MKPVFTLLFLLLLSGNLLAQQTIRGTVSDGQTLRPLVGARVILVDSDPVIGTLTDESGDFRLENIPLGRQGILITYFGYGTALRNNIIVNAAQEVVLEIEMEEQVQSTEVVEVVAKAEKNSTLNELVSVSGRTFSVEEALRYAGSRNDPARMAQNFAGVSGVNDNRNDIIIRGNSPAGVLWRMEGIDIPNPNHFGALGTTGGPVSMVNNNNLSDADFLTSAFPAEYGNALAGVFDLNLRNGNNEKHEFMGQVGFNGFEVGAEGPFSKNSKASYIANFRYSTLGVFDALGIDVGTGSAIPEYQDLTFKINLPTKNAGRFVIFGFGGNSAIDFLDSESEEPNFFNGEATDLYNRAAAGMVGISHTHLFSEKTYGKLVIGTSLTRSGTRIDSLSTTTGNPNPWYAEQYQQFRYSANYQVNSKLSVRNHIRAGVILDIYDIDMIDSVRLEAGEFRRLRDFSGRTEMIQAYAQWQHKFGNNLSMNTGIHGQYLMLNDSWAVEPRWGLKYQVGKNKSLNLGFGVHNQLQPLVIYFVQTQIGDETLLTNQDLDFTQSVQAVLGYDQLLAPNLRLKVETYYQSLTDVPVETDPSAFSLINAGADFSFPTVDSLVNEGTGENYGLELTLEKFFSKGYYFLLTASLFDSKYTGSDGETYNTVFNSNYILNALGGKEFQIGRNTLSIDAKITYAGGRRFTPIDLQASREAQTTVLDTSQPFAEQNPDYLRADLKATFRMNGRRFTQEWSLDMQNITNRQNVFSQQYSRELDDIQTTYQIGRFPVIQYRILF